MSSFSIDPQVIKDPSIRTPGHLVAAGDRVVYRPENGGDIAACEFLRLANGDAAVAFRLFGLCEWQHPETLLHEDRDALPGDRCFPELFDAETGAQLWVGANQRP